MRPDHSSLTPDERRRELARLLAAGVLRLHLRGLLSADAATSMGRLILNVLLSFAQFEREIISERTRDQIAAARRKGKWAGGHPLLF
jgi:DNA invertase Pin-like site-specific DNA recombinase